MRYWAVIPAAGIGQRMGVDIPKQYLPLAGSTVIDCTISSLLEHQSISGIAVALAENDQWWAKSRYASHDKVTRVTGGRERADSVLNGLKFLMQKADPEDWVLVHDAARPCITQQDLNKMLELLSGHPVGGLLGMPVRDTMKRTDAEGQVQNTVERNNLWHAFTPQMFRLEMLYQALTDALDANIEITDEASAMEWAGHQPLMVEGRGDNIKITRPADLGLAEYYLSQSR